MDAELLFKFLVDQRALSYFRSAEIDNFEMALLAQQNVLRFQVSMNDPNALEVFDDGDDFCQVENSKLVRHLGFVIMHKGSEISALTKLQAKV